MAITLKKLCKYAAENYDMRLVCGEESTDRPVSWVHMLEDPKTASFLHGQELVFVTGVGHSGDEWLIDLAKNLVEHQASGLVLNVGYYIQTVPQELVAYCSRVHFPLYTVPWKTRIVDITNDFCRKIIKAEESDLTVAGAFRDAIFEPSKAAEFRPLLERREFDLNADFCVAAILLPPSFEEQLSESDKDIRMSLSKILFRHSDRFTIFRQDKYLIAVAQSFPPPVLEKAMDTLGVLHGRSFPDGLHAGISLSDAGLSSLPQSYKRAVALLKMAEKQKKTWVSYRNIGVYRLLIEVDDPRVLEQFYADTLGALESYDDKNHTDYMATLRSYLEHNASVQEVAQESYMHRNTINYKIKRIREILDSDLNYQDGLRLYLAFLAKELL
jgi:Regulator of polyketide synthase expression